MLVGAGYPQRQAIPQVRSLIFSDDLSVLAVDNWRNFPNLVELVLKDVTGTQALLACHQHFPIMRLVAGLHALQRLEVTFEQGTAVCFGSSQLKYLKVGPVLDY